MQRISLLIGCAILFCAAASVEGVVIPFSNSQEAAAKEASLGVDVTPTGPKGVTSANGGWEVTGATSAFRSNAIASEYYSGTATFDDPIRRITLDVARANNSGWKNLLTFTAFDQGKKVASQTVDLKPLGDGTRITLSAPAIDSIEWNGEGWVFHPYYVTALEFDAATKSVGSGLPGSTPSVGTPAPEPVAPMAFLFASLSLLRRKRNVAN